MKFLGFRRPDGGVGVRNHLAVIPSVFCANHVAERIAQQIQGAVAMTHGVGCSQVGEDLEQTARTLIQMGRHPNVGAVLVVGLGCERFKPKELYEAVKATGKMVEMVVIQEVGGSLKAIEEGTHLARQMAQALAMQQREEADVSELIIGLECGGTDATSGLAANPAVGVCSDLLVGQGASTIFSETTELLGAEHVLAARAVSCEVADEIFAAVAATEQKLADATADPRFQHRSALISTGNFDGGVSTVVEKALGNIHKAGRAPIQSVLRFGEVPQSHGLHMMDTPGQDGESVTGLVAGGCQIVLFTSGRGTPTGFPIAPVIKITGNSRTYSRMEENIDINAGAIIDGSRTLRQVGQEMLQEVVDVATGKPTKAEILGHHELFIIPRLGV
ncbi:MAG: UxaA family hydrolase [Bacillota bacterium]